VKRLLPYVILALAFHAVILSTDFGWLNFTSGMSTAAKSLSITLSTPRLQKPLPATPQKNIVKKARQKKNLKALTRRKPTIKTRDVVRPTPIVKQHIPLEVHAKTFSPVDSDIKPDPHQLPGDTAFIKKIHRVPEGFSEPTITAATRPATQSDDTLSGSGLKIARPLYRQNTPPPYPRKARRLGYEGIVMLKVLIDENGRVDRLMLLESSGYDLLDRAALLTVKKWLFEPGSEGGTKKKMWVKIPVRFQLK
jgi:protein TonB